MLFSLSEYLTQFHRGFNVFQYLTMRTILGVLTALLIALIVGPVMIRYLSSYNIGQSVRSDGPESHLSKAGTPTMGGALILVAIVTSTLLWADLSSRFVWVVLFVTIGFGAVGWVDDYKKIVFGNSKGLSARMKILWQSVIGLIAALALYHTAQFPIETQLIVPFIKNILIDLGWFYVVVTYFVIVGSSNAVNLTDGLDGLAILPTVLVGGALGVFAYLTGTSIFPTTSAFPMCRAWAKWSCSVGAGRRRARFPVVQHLPGAGFHGRCRCAGARRRARYRGGHRAPGTGAFHHGWHFRRRNLVGDAAGCIVQADRPADFPHGAAASPL